jgi:hypothetical protein
MKHVLFYNIKNFLDLRRKGSNLFWGIPINEFDVPVS